MKTVDTMRSIKNTVQTYISHIKSIIFSNFDELEFKYFVAMTTGEDVIQKNGNKWIRIQHPKNRGNSTKNQILQKILRTPQKADNSPPTNFYMMSF